MKYYFKGTIILAKKNTDRLGELRKYMLVESMDPDFSFQLVCISGYNAGTIFGYIRKDPEGQKAKVVGVSFDFLLKQIIYNLGDIDMITYKVQSKDCASE
jgi:hypothetical protein